MKKDVVVTMPESLEATPIAHLVQLANRFESRIYFEMEQTSGRTRVNAKSIMGMMSLMLTPGSSVTIVAEGQDEAEAVTEMEAFLTATA